MLEYLFLVTKEGQREPSLTHCVWIYSVQSVYHTLAFKVQVLAPAAVGQASIQAGDATHVQVGGLCQLEVPVIELSSLVAKMVMVLHGATELLMRS